MKKVKLAIDDILIVLDAMQENGTKDIIIFEHEGLPALCDANEPENMITFATFDESEENAEGEQVH